MYGSTILSMLIEALLTLQRCHWRSDGGKEAPTLFKPWAHTIDTSDPDDFIWRFGFCGYVKVAAFSYHPSHSNFSSIHLLVLHVTRLSSFIGMCPPCLSKHLWIKLLSQVLNLKLCEILPLSLKGFWHNRNLLFLLFCLLNGSSWEEYPMTFHWGV